MDIKEIRERKIKLQQTLLKLFQEFESETGVYVSKIEWSREFDGAKRAILKRDVVSHVRIESVVVSIDIDFRA